MKMCKLTLKSVRAEVWRVLKNEVTVIRLQQLDDSVAACSTYDDTEIDIWVDNFSVRVDFAVVHEILHKIFDNHFKTFSTYHLYEYWITALEKPLFKGLNRKEKAKWRKLIDSKTVKSRK